MYVPRKITVAAPPVESPQTMPRTTDPTPASGPALGRIWSSLYTVPRLGTKLIGLFILFGALLLVRRSYLAENNALKKEIAASRARVAVVTPAEPRHDFPIVNGEEVISPKTFVSNGSERDDAFFGQKDSPVVLML
jgi:hypothetical protein